nr:methyltransferase domain-containing protein [Colletotrichum truncatum]KAF6788100.1 methyltransferase domain-containing protein [Colletotrichum truncatum]
MSTATAADSAAQAAATDVRSNNAVDHEIFIQADDQSDTSSVDLQSVASSSTSVTSSMLDYRVENGRTYHRYKDGKYNFPNDERELDRLDMQHHLFLLTFNNRLGTAPPNDPGAKVGRVLDVGTGTGIWAMDFGDEHPEAEVYGIDLSATQPEVTDLSSAPPNVRFEIDDLDEPWTFSKPFDYIHSRGMNASIKDWGEYIQKCYDNLAPGGYLELIELYFLPLSDDGTLKSDHKIMKAIRLLGEASQKLGRSVQDVKELKPVMIESGFKDVVMVQYKWPTNAWPKDKRFKELGMWSNENILQGWEGVCMAPFTRALGWTREEVLVLLAETRKEFNDTSIHAYFSLWTIYGRKPTNEEAAAGEK